MNTPVSGTIKALEWTFYPEDDEPEVGVWIGRHGGFRFYIHPGHDFQLTSIANMGIKSHHSSLEAAKAAAQSDWESFIRGAIEPTDLYDPQDGSNDPGSL